MNYDDKKKYKYILYVRKSTDTEDRQIQSIEDQKRELDKEIKKYHLNVIETIEESRSAKKPGRSGFDKMMQMIKLGQADGILCWKLNRLSRNPIDGGQIQWFLQNSIVKSIITTSREYLPSDNVMMMAFELGMANQFVLDLSRDVTRGMKSKVEKGWRPGIAPIGYLNDRHGEKGNKIIFMDEEKFSIVRKMWDLLLTGNHSVNQIHQIINKQFGLRNKNGNNLCLSAIYKIFNNPFYCGEFTYDGEIYQGKHKSMISKEEFDMAQVILGKSGKPRPKYKRLPFNGIIRCSECGGMITAEEKFKKTKNGIKKYLYHHCSHNKHGKECNQKSIAGEELIRQINGYLGSITIPEEFLHWAVEILKNQNQIEEYDRDIILKNQQSNFNSCLKRIDNLINLYISTENIDRTLLNDDEFKQQKTSLMTEKQKIGEEIRKVEMRVDDWVELTEKTFNFATYAKHWFDEGDVEVKTNILRTLGQNFYLKDKKLTIELQKPYLTLHEGLKNEILQKAMLEPSIYCEDKRKNSHFQTVFSQWSG